MRQGRADVELRVFFGFSLLPHALLARLAFNVPGLSSANVVVIVVTGN